jgi:transglutaminase-like putative cysteine protease
MALKRSELDTGLPWRLAIEHVTNFRYTEVVRASFNEIRMTPATTADQEVISQRITTKPQANRFRYRDYWGTIVDYFDMRTPHDELEINSFSIVERYPSKQGEVHFSLNQLKRPDVYDRMVEYIIESELTRIHPELEALVDEIRYEPDSPKSILDSIIDVIAGHMSYSPGVTGVETTARQAFEKRSGVCQDYAHLLIGCLRHLGIPARYVSGYFAARMLDDSESVEGESHAWVEAWLGRWLSADPTNPDAEARQYIKIGHGRDYTDTAPLKGVYDSTGSGKMTTSVTITRMSLNSTVLNLATN